MTIPQFTLRLYGPTPSSKQFAVACRFGGDYGMTMKLNNNGSKCGTRVKAFGCAFISNYPAEAEWLFCGGRFEMKLEGIRLMSNAKFYYPYFNPLFGFDAMLNHRSYKLSLHQSRI